jgi:TIR domain
MGVFGNYEKQWDFFVAHAGADSGIAESLYEQLACNFHVFLDSRSLLPGDDWDLVLATAQSRSRITVVLISTETTTAYYQREEIAAAIALARDSVQSHRVIPVFTDDDARDNSAVPYGLRLKHSISISSSGGIEGAAQRLTRALAPTLAMSSSQILQRHENRALVEVGLRLVPTVEFQSSLSLGASQKSYVFIGDYEEQKFRTLKEILANLLIGDSFERLYNSNVNWSAIRFSIGNSNYRKLDLFPATWKAAFRILSHPERLARFQPTNEEIEKLGPRVNRDYMSKDQDYWYSRLTTPRHINDLPDSLLKEDLGISNTCFDGGGLAKGTIPSRIFFVRNVPVSTLDSRVIPMGFPADGEILM